MQEKLEDNLHFQTFVLSFKRRVLLNNIGQLMVFKRNRHPVKSTSWVLKLVEMRKFWSDYFFSQMTYCLGVFWLNKRGWGKWKIFNSNFGSNDKEQKKSMIKIDLQFQVCRLPVIIINSVSNHRRICRVNWGFTTGLTSWLGVVEPGHAHINWTGRRATAVR